MALDQLKSNRIREEGAAGGDKRSTCLREGMTRRPVDVDS